MPPFTKIEFVGIEFYHYPAIGNTILILRIVPLNTKHEESIYSCKELGFNCEICLKKFLKMLR